MLKQLLELEKLFLLVLLVLLVRLVLHQLEPLAHLGHLEHKALAELLERLVLQVLVALLALQAQLLQIWFIPTQTHRFQTQTQETMFTTDTRLTIQIGMDTKFVVLTITTLNTTTLALITEHHISQPKEKMVQHMLPQITTVALIPLLLTIQTRIAIMVAITTPRIMMDLMAEFITGTGIGGMRIIK